MMAIFDYQKREINLKVVYYGPGLSGKTTNIQHIYDKTRPEHKGKLVSLATQTDRTLFFDFLPIELGTLGGYKVRFHLYTVPGQVHYDATRKLVLKGVDGVIFVADSQREMKDANIQSLVNMEKNLLSYNKKLRDLPVVLQANKRDLPSVMSMEEMNQLLNRYGFPLVEAVAARGTGVLETLRLISKLVLRSMKDRVDEETSAAVSPAVRPPVFAPREAPPARTSGDTPPARSSGDTPPARSSGDTPPARTSGDTPPARTSGDGSAGRPVPAHASASGSAFTFAPSAASASSATGAGPARTEPAAVSEVEEAVVPAYAVADADVECDTGTPVGDGEPVLPAHAFSAGTGGTPEAVSDHIAPFLIDIPGLGTVELSLNVEVRGVRLVSAEPVAQRATSPVHSAAAAAIEPLPPMDEAAPAAEAAEREETVAVPEPSPPPLEPLALESTRSEAASPQHLPPLSPEPASFEKDEAGPAPTLDFATWGAKGQIGMPSLGPEPGGRESGKGSGDAPGEGYDPTFGELEFSDPGNSSGADRRGTAETRKGGIFGIFKKKDRVP
jgi:signal recognition particle receptor subunit beta